MKKEQAKLQAVHKKKLGKETIAETCQVERLSSLLPLSVSIVVPVSDANSCGHKQAKISK